MARGEVLKRAESHRTHIEINSLLSEQKKKSNSDKQVWGETIRAFTEKNGGGKYSKDVDEMMKMGWEEVEKEQKKEAEKTVIQKVLGWWWTSGRNSS